MPLCDRLGRVLQPSILKPEIGQFHQLAHPLERAFQSDHAAFGEVNAGFRPKRADHKRVVASFRFHVQAADHPLTVQQWKNIVAVGAPFRRHENLDPVIEAEEIFQAFAVSDDGVEGAEDAQTLDGRP